MQFGLGTQVVEVDVALSVAGNDDDLHPRHRRARGVRAVRRDRDQADVAPPFASRLVVGPDDEEAGVLALRSGIRHQRYSGKSGDFGELLFEGRGQFRVPFDLIAGREGVDGGKAGVGDRKHFRGGVQLHRARAERDHRRGQRQVFRFEPFHVAEQFGLGAVRRKNRVGENRAGAMVGGSDRLIDRSRQRGSLGGKYLREIVEVGVAHGLVESDA